MNLLCPSFFLAPASGHRLYCIHPCSPSPWLRFWLLSSYELMGPVLWSNDEVARQGPLSGTGFHTKLTVEFRASYQTSLHSKFLIPTQQL